MRALGILAVCASAISGAFAQSTCGNVQLQLTPDYSFAIGSSGGGSAYSLTLGGQALAQGPITQLDLFHYDNSLAGTSGIAPAQSVGTSFVPGKFGSAVAVAAGGTLSYPQAGNLSLQDGTVEMWVSPQYDGTNSLYSTASQVLFQYYWGPSGANQLVLAEGNNGNGAYFFVGAAGVYAGNPQASGFARWKAGDWHHLAITYSKANGRVRIYVDGTLVAETNATIQFPAGGPANFTIGSDAFGHGSNFVVDEVRISSDEKTAATLASDASRTGPFANNEVAFSLAGVGPGQLTYSVTGCGTASLTYAGIPIFNFSPASGLLAPGSTSVAVSFQTLAPTLCRYSVGTAQAYSSSMQPLDAGPAVATHAGSIDGLSSDTRVLNQVYIRCASNPDFLQSLTYRAVAAPSMSFPHVGSIWWGSYVEGVAPQQAQKIQLFLGPGFSPAQANALRAANPNVLILPFISAEEFPTGQPVAGLPPPQVPDNYYMKDIHGNRILTYPGNYMANMTLPQVAEFVAQFAYQIITQSDLAFDGIFFDNYQLTISKFTTDANGNSVQIDSNVDGQPDDPGTLDAAWSAGVLHMIDTLRKLLPYGYISAHLSPLWPIPASEFSAFNGNALNKGAIQAKEGLYPFGDLWSAYQSWFSAGLSPSINMVQSSPPSQIAYGYGSFPLDGSNPAVLPTTAEFGRTYYPSMRFGLGLALMNDGYFTHDYGDVSADVSWWYDEYDFPLGSPLSPSVQVGNQASPNLLVNGDFESALASPWSLNVVNDGQAAGKVALDSTVAAHGGSSAHVAVSRAGTAIWHVELEQANLSLSGGTPYQVQFWARADTPRTITIQTQGGAPNFSGYGLSTQIPIGTSWAPYSATFTAPITATDGRLEFWVGDLAGEVWLDNVMLSQDSPQTYRRDYSNGVVLLNGSGVTRTIAVGPGLQRFSGAQAPKYQYIVDDADAAFTFAGPWNTVTYDTGFAHQTPRPPYYHAWQSKCRQLDVSIGTAQWSLNPPADGQYTLQVWLPAAPSAGGWTKNAIYEVVSNGSVIYTATVDQSTAAAGDAWHTIATGLSLTTAGAPFVRVHNGGADSLVADAVYVTSAARYNDGSPAQQVTLGPFDSILLQRQTLAPVPNSRINAIFNAASYQTAIGSGGFVSITGTGFAGQPRLWTSSDFANGNLPQSLDGVSVTINGKPAYIEYISPTQINAIAPDDDAVGQVQVQVTTPQGSSYTGTVLKQKLSPAFFMYQSGTTSYVAAVHLDGTLVGPAGPSSRPAVPGEVIEIYGTGFGPTNPASPTAQLISQPAPVNLPVTVSIGGVDAPVQWAGIVSSGLYQLNVQIPDVTSGDKPVQASVSGFQSVASAFLAVAR